MDVRSMSASELAELIALNRYEPSDELRRLAAQARDKYYGRKIYIRGLIEFTNICKNNCLYCGIRGGNSAVNRYRLTDGEILGCVDKGAELGFNTFVLQGGEDACFDDDKLCWIVYAIKEKYPECAVTLSVGERSYESYKALRSAGADRYLLRHETADKEHYSRLHPSEMSFENRIKCLYELKELGYQVGAGFMVGSPYQTEECLVKDLIFLKQLEPDMVGIGPFIPQSQTPFADKPAGSAGLTLTMLALVRLMLPYVLLPATTALGTISSDARIAAFEAGANVVMPNLSPPQHRADYALYNNKLCTGSEAAENLRELREQAARAGYEIDMSRGDAAERKM